jgi:hypothetical protein
MLYVSQYWRNHNEVLSNLTVSTGLMRSIEILDTSEHCRNHSEVPLYLLVSRKPT